VTAPFKGLTGKIPTARTAGGAAGYFNPEIISGLQGEGFQSDKGMFNMQRLLGAAGGYGLGRGAAGSKNVWKNSLQPSTRQAWNQGINQPLRGGGTGFFTGMGVDEVGDMTGLYDTHGMGKWVGMGGGALARSPWATNLAAKSYGPLAQAPSKLSQMAETGRKAFTIGGGGNKGIATAQNAAMWGPMIAGGSQQVGTGLFEDAATQKASTEVVKAYKENPQFKAGIKAAEKQLATANTMGSFVGGFNKIFDPLLGMIFGADQVAKWGTMQKMMVAFGGLMAIGGGAAGLLGGSKTGGMIGILGALLMAGGAFGDKVGLFGGDDKKKPAAGGEQPAPVDDHGADKPKETASAGWSAKQDAASQRYKGEDAMRHARTGTPALA
jgi:hypothetical protein